MRASKILQTELDRRQHIINALQAQAFVLHRTYSEAIHRTARLGGDHAANLLRELGDKTSAIVGALSPPVREAMAAAVRTHLGQTSATAPTTDDPGTREQAPTPPTTTPTSAAVRQALRRCADYGKLQSELHRERALSAVLAEERDQRLLQLDGALPPAIGDDHLQLHLSADREARRTDERESYFAMIDSEVPEMPEGTPELPDGRKIYFKLPRRLLQHEDAEHDAEPFYRPNMVAALQPEGEDEKYESMRAVLRVGSATSEIDDSVQISSIVDSGAAWCAIRLSTLKQKFPHLVSQIQATRMKFRDASGNRMSLVGRVEISIWVGTRRLTTSAFVFDRLGAEFLLGVNAIRRNGCVIDGGLNRFYVRGDADLGVPLISSSPGTPAAEPTADNLALEEHPSTESELETAVLSLDYDRRALVLGGQGGGHQTPCEPHEASDGVRMVMGHDVNIDPGQTALLDPKLLGVPEGSLLPIELVTCPRFLGA